MNEYLIYNRKSTDDTDNQKNSLGYQKNENLKLSNLLNKKIADYTEDSFCANGIIDEKHTAFKTGSIDFTKDGRAQFKIERPKFQKMVQLLYQKKFKGVICLCWDRLCRNDHDEIIIKELMKNGVEFIFAQAKYEDSSSGALHMDIDGMFSNHYSRVIGERVRNMFIKMRAEGKCTYPSPIGYLDQGSDNKPLDPERAPIIIKLFEMYATGEWSLSQLAKWANKQGLTTKSSRRKRTKQEIANDVQKEDIPKSTRPVNAKTIENILRNPFYIGKLKIDKRDYTKYIDGYYHQPLIDIKLFNKVQAVLRSRNVSIHYIDKDFYIYRGIIRCTCGRCFSPYTQKNINYYRVRCIDNCNNQDKNLNEDAINWNIENLLSKIHFTDEELQEIETRSKTGLDHINHKRNSELDNLNNQRKRAYDDLNYLTQNKITLLRTMAMTPEAIGLDEIRLKKELEIIDLKTSAHQEGATEMLKYVINFSELIKMAHLYYKFALDAEKREIITNVFTELVFADKKLVNYVAKDGYKALLDRHPKENTLLKTSSVLSGSAGRTRTDDPLVTSTSMFP